MLILDLSDCRVKGTSIKNDRMIIFKLMLKRLFFNILIINSLKVSSNFMGEIFYRY